jgi:hypothetical protein
VELGDPNTFQFNGPVQTITSDVSGNIYAAGVFWNDNTEKIFVAKYDINTNSWSELGKNTSSFNEGIRAPLIVDVNGNVYAVGQSRLPDYSSEGHVAKLDINTDTWSELGGTIQPFFHSIPISIVTDAFGNIYASDSDPNSGTFIYRWDESKASWSILEALGLGNKLAIDPSGNLIAGGGIHGCYIAKWDGISWSGMGDLDSNVNSWISTIVVDNWGNIYASGNFDPDNFQGFGKRNVNTNTWSRFGDGKMGGSDAIAIDGSRNVYAAGDSYVAKWDGSKWINYGNLKTNGKINTLFIDAYGNIYAGGDFTNDHNNIYIAVHYQ